ncbi:hypothetical protein NEPAR06_1774 [Nematocida parisii]|nr:hypothetical protein NEPAR07_0564 [Nematocida parisii]KAI5155378.1 hypothetical protein NEPAR06_1774 [Nematocida parisii]
MKEKDILNIEGAIASPISTKESQKQKHTPDRSASKQTGYTSINNLEIQTPKIKMSWGCVNFNTEHIKSNINVLVDILEQELLLETQHSTMFLILHTAIFIDMHNKMHGLAKINKKCTLFMVQHIKCFFTQRFKSAISHISKELDDIESHKNEGTQYIKEKLYSAAISLINGGYIKNIETEITHLYEKILKSKTTLPEKYIPYIYRQYAEKLFLDRVDNKRLYCDLHAITDYCNRIKDSVKPKPYVTISFFAKKDSQKNKKPESTKQIDLFAKNAKGKYNIDCAIDNLLNNRINAVKYRNHSMLETPKLPLDETERAHLIKLKKDWYDISNFYYKLYKAIGTRVSELEDEFLITEEYNTQEKISKYPQDLERYYERVIEISNAVLEEFKSYPDSQIDYIKSKMDSLKGLIKTSLMPSFIEGQNSSNKLINNGIEYISPLAGVGIAAMSFVATCGFMAMSIHLMSLFSQQN